MKTKREEYENPWDLLWDQAKKNVTSLHSLIFTPFFVCTQSAKDHRRYSRFSNSFHIFSGYTRAFYVAFNLLYLFDFSTSYIVKCRRWYRDEKKNRERLK